MEKVKEKKVSGLSRNALRTWGLFFVLTGIIGRSILQHQLLGIGQVSGEELLAYMQSSSDAMIFATLALLFQALETCAVPIFTYLLVEGFQHTSDYMKYVLRVAGVAVVSEIPYNLAMSGKILDFGSRNPAFALVLGLIMLYFYKRYEEKSGQNRMIKIMVTVAALIWAIMLQIDTGVCMVIVIAVLWIFRGNSLYQNLAGASASMACGLTSPFFMASPMGFLLVHFYNGEKGAENRVVNYLAYPVMLLLIGVISLFMR